MKNAKNLFVWLLCTVFLLSSVAGCAREDIQTPDTTAPSAAAAVPKTTEDTTAGRSAHKDNLPDTLTFDSETVRLYFRDTIETYNVFGTESEGDVVTDALWQRNLAVQQRLDVTFEYIRSAASSGGEVTKAIRQTAAAGLNEWDIILTTNNTTVTAGLDNILLDLSALPHLDLSQPYWWLNAMDNVSLTGDSYRYLIGDFMLLNYLRTGAFFYNKNLYESLYRNPDELYTDVLDGTWTCDRMLTLAQGAYTDANGNGITDEEDIVGYAIGSTYEEQMSQFAEGFDLQTYIRGEDGSITLDMGNEHIFDVSRRLYEIVHQSCALIVEKNLAAAGTQFNEGNVLFLPGRFDRVVAAGFREMEDDYGILPYPKYDENQKDYVSLCHNSSASACVLNSQPTERYGIIGATLEALGSETYRSVTDIFLETALKTKYSRDSASGQVIDIIVGSIRKDLVHEYSSYTANIFNTLVKNAPAAEGVYISAYTKTSTAAQASLDKTIENLRNENGR